MAFPVKKQMFIPDFKTPLDLLVVKDGDGNFTANTITATLDGSATNFSGQLDGDIVGGQKSTKISKIGGIPIEQITDCVNKVLEATMNGNTLAQKGADGKLIGRLTDNEESARASALVAAEAASKAVTSSINAQSYASMAGNSSTIAQQNATDAASSHVLAMETIESITELYDLIVPSIQQANDDKETIDGILNTCETLVDGAVENASLSQLYASNALQSKINASDALQTIEGIRDNISVLATTASASEAAASVAAVNTEQHCLAAEESKNAAGVSATKAQQAELNVKTIMDELEAVSIGNIENINEQIEAAAISAAASLSEAISAKNSSEVNASEFKIVADSVKAFDIPVIQNLALSAEDNATACSANKQLALTSKESAASAALRSANAKSNIDGYMNTVTDIEDTVSAYDFTTLLAETDTARDNTVIAKDATRVAADSATVTISDAVPDENTEVVLQGDVSGSNNVNTVDMIGGVDAATIAKNLAFGVSSGGEIAKYNETDSTILTATTFNGDLVGSATHAETVKNIYFDGETNLRITPVETHVGILGENNVLVNREETRGDVNDCVFVGLNLVTGGVATNSTLMGNVLFTDNTLVDRCTVIGNNVFAESGKEEFDAIPNNTAVWEKSAIDITAIGSNIGGNGKSMIGNTLCGCNINLNVTDSGSYNTIIGSNSSAEGTTNSTIIGNSINLTTSNKIRLGDTNIIKIEGQVMYSNPSDARFKTQINENIPGLDFVSTLRPVTYHIDSEGVANVLNIQKRDYDAERSNSQNLKTGFIAQDVEQAAKAFEYEFDAVIFDSTSYSLAYSQFVIPVIQALREQLTINQQQEEIIDILLEKLRILESK